MIVSGVRSVSSDDESLSEDKEDCEWESCDL